MKRLVPWLVLAALCLPSALATPTEIVFTAPGSSTAFSFMVPGNSTVLNASFSVGFDRPSNATNPVVEAYKPGLYAVSGQMGYNWSTNDPQNIEVVPFTAEDTDNISFSDGKWMNETFTCPDGTGGSDGFCPALHFKLRFGNSSISEILFCWEGYALWNYSRINASLYAWNVTGARWEHQKTETPVRQAAFSSPDGPSLPSFQALRLQGTDFLDANGTARVLVRTVFGWMDPLKWRIDLCTDWVKAVGFESALMSNIHDFRDRNNSTAWESYGRDIFAQGVRTCTPGKVIELGREFSEQECANISALDGVWNKVNVTQEGQGSTPEKWMCHFFRLNISDRNPEALAVTWDGWGVENITTSLYLMVYDCADGKWSTLEIIYYNESRFHDYQNVRMSGIVPATYLDGNGTLYVGAFKDYGESCSGTNLHTDYVSATVLSGSPPRDVSLSMDIGIDGAAEWSFSGQMTGPVVAEGPSVIKGIQMYVNAHPSDGNLTVPVKFTTAHAGILEAELRELKVDLQPVLVRNIPDFVLQQGEVRPDAINLMEIFHDDSEYLIFLVEPMEKPDLVGLTFQLDPKTQRQTGKVTLQASANMSGTCRCVMKADDPYDKARLSNPFNITVLPPPPPPAPVFRPPLVDPVGDIVTPEGNAVHIHVNASDNCNDSREIVHTLEFTDDTPLFDMDPHNGTADFAARAVDIGDHSVNVTVRDTMGGCSTTIGFWVRVLAVNEPPVIQGRIPDITVNAEQLYQHSFNASDPDAGDSLVWWVNTTLGSLASRPQGPPFTFHFNATNSEAGKHAATLHVRDSSGLEALMTFNITVLRVNHPPDGLAIVTPLPGQVIKKGDSVKLCGTALDPDGDLLTYTWKLNGTVIGAGKELVSKFTKTGALTLELSVSDGNVTISTYVQVTVKATKPAENVTVPGFESTVVYASFGTAAVLTLFFRRSVVRGNE